ncbi:sensor histidine kinase [Oceanobacillus alkalisoli]|uniref:sensor histidine kinase n=1 Tax=Oceanobacillus alkalisoli TaxID=2925113 RepID=UPI001F11E18F|nr:ATP-binding protein [Oceanobacillus alkalisoli]MCF3943575.1 ATP-binding protein [Oceanobacillus alkalisoli]
MKRVYFYWVSIASLAVIHIEFAGRALPFDLPFFVSIFLAFLLIFLLQRKLMVHIDALGTKENLRLYSIQLLLLIIYVLTEPGLISLIPLLTFILLEANRHIISHKLHNNRQLIQAHKREMEQMNDTFLIVRKERHDFLKHISSLHYMLENNNHKEATTYLNELVEGYKETNLSIQGERGTVAGVLHHSYRQGQEEGIEVIYDLEAAISGLPLSDRDLTALIGNILDNALEASAEWQRENGKKPQIILQSFKRSGLFMLTCKNCTRPLPNDVLDHLFTKRSQSTKSGNHEGLGTQIIAHIVEKHAGYLDFVYKNQIFTLQIKLPAILK